MFSFLLRQTSTKNFQKLRFINYLMALAIVMLIPTISFASGQLTLALGSDPTNQNIAGYRIYYKNGSSGVPYNGTGLSDESGLSIGDSPYEIPVSILNDATQTEMTLTGFIAGDTYHFTATVYDRNGNESAYSNEVKYVAPNLPTYEIRASTQGNGTISPAGVTTVKEGEPLTYTIAAASGHHITDVLVNGDSVGAQTSYLFDEVSATHTIEAIFEANQIVTPPDPDTTDPVDQDTTDPVDQDTNDTGTSTGDDSNSSVIIDDGDPGTARNGSWNRSGATDFYGSQSLYSKQVGTDYTFESRVKGLQEVALWWTGWPSRCSDVPVQIYDGDQLLEVVNIDQSQDSGQWNTLGSYSFSSAARVMVLSESTQCSTAADAIKFDEMDQPDIIDDGDPGTTRNGSWNRSGAIDFYGSQSLYSRQVGADYTFESRVKGLHEIALWWTGWSSRCSDVPVQIYDGDQLLEVVNIDQSQNSGQWNTLGSYSFSGTARVMVLSESTQCSTAADAVKFNEIDQPEIIDDGDPGTTRNGSWNKSGATDFYGDQSLYSKQVGADYTYTSHIDGSQEVALWWTGWRSRCSDVPVEIYDGDQLLEVVNIDQSQNSGQWNALGTYNFTGTASVTVKSQSTRCSTAADAVKFSK